MRARSAGARGDLLSRRGRLLRGGGDLLGRGGGLLGDGGDLGHVALGARGAGADLLDGGGDRRDLGADALDGLVDAQERLARRSTVATPSSVRAAPSATTPTTWRVCVLHLADQGRDLGGGALGLLGELAHLLGDDGEAAALLAGAGGLDGGVQRQQVRLLGERR